jgi:hypothetical protein
LHKDPTSEQTYFKALQLLENTLNLKLRKIQLLNISNQELGKILQINKIFLETFKGFYFLKNDTIYIIDGNEEDLQTFIHEILHSNSIFHYNNSPIWIFEGLTKALTEFIMIKQQIPPPIDYYLIQEKNFWLNKIQTHHKLILEAYFSDNLAKAIDILKIILKTKKNLLEISFNEL